MRQYAKTDTKKHLDKNGDLPFLVRTCDYLQDPVGYKTDKQKIAEYYGVDIKTVVYRYKETGKIIHD
jgi:hypothetical protein